MISYYSKSTDLTWRSAVRKETILFWSIIHQNKVLHRSLMGHFGSACFGTYIFPFICMITVGQHVHLQSRPITNLTTWLAVSDKQPKSSLKMGKKTPLLPESESPLINNLQTQDDQSCLVSQMLQTASSSFFNHQRVTTFMLWLSKDDGQQIQLPLNVRRALKMCWTEAEPHHGGTSKTDNTQVRETQPSWDMRHNKLTISQLK